MGYYQGPLAQGTEGDTTQADWSSFASISTGPSWSASGSAVAKHPIFPKRGRPSCYGTVDRAGWIFGAYPWLPPLRGPSGAAIHGANTCPGRVPRIANLAAMRARQLT